MSKTHKNVCANVTYIEKFLLLASTNTGCVSISSCACLVGIPIRITNSAIELKIWAITAGTKKYKSIIKTNKKKHDIITLSAKSRLISQEVLISKALSNPFISHDELF